MSKELIAILPGDGIGPEVTIYHRGHRDIKKINH